MRMGGAGGVMAFIVLAQIGSVAAVTKRASA